MTINDIDYQVVSFFNQYCRRSLVFDKAMVVLVNNTLLKGGVLMLLLWYEWFVFEANKLKRVQIISMLCGCFLSMFVVRVLTKILPFRPRPILAPGNHLLAAFGLNTQLVDNTNSFPSDHASLFFGLVAGFFFVSRRWGWISLIYVTIAIVFPRLYLGWHYPTDILGGAVMGVFFVALANTKSFKSSISERIFNYSVSHPQIFYPALFLLTYQVATLFEGIRSISSFAFHPYTAAV